MPATPGLRQMRPRMLQQQAPTPRGWEATQATPYQQQVFPPKHPAPKPSATPSASQDHRDPAREAEGARGRSSSQGPRGGQRRGRSSTRGSQKRRWGCPQQQSDGPDGQLCGLRVEMRSHPFHRLLLGSPDRFPGTGRVAHGHHQIPCGNGQMEGQRVDGYKGFDATPVYALRG